MPKILKALPFLSLFVLLAGQALAQQGVGIVSGIRGDATVRHERAPQTQRLKFKDDVFWQDTLSTGSDAQLRMDSNSVRNVLEWTGSSWCSAPRCLAT